MMLKKGKTLCLGALTLLLALAACSDFLDIRPLGKVIPGTLAEYRALLTRAYQQPFNDRAVCDMRTTHIRIKDVNSEKNYYADIEVWNDAAEKASTYSFDWAYHYHVIYNANAVISQQNSITDGSKEEIDQLVGEAYMLRAYMMFDLVNLYGQPYTKPGAPKTKSVPIKTNMDLEEVSDRNTVEEVYVAILQDIDEARKRMNKQQWEEAYRYRFNTLSADAFASRVYLYMGKWQQAYDAAERVLAKKDSLEDLRNKDAKLPNDFRSVEVINASDNAQSYSTQRAFWVDSVFRLRFDDKTDLRAARYFAKPNKEGKISLLKNDGSSTYRCTFRTGEMYLNAAEAAARLGKEDAARQRLLQLMEKRYTPEGVAAKKQKLMTESGDQLLNSILAERELELSFEGHTWFDLRRTTRPAITKVIDGKTYTLLKDDPRYTLKLPKEAGENNPNLLN